MGSHGLSWALTGSLCAEWTWKHIHSAKNANPMNSNLYTIFEAIHECIVFFGSLIIWNSGLIVLLACALFVRVCTCCNAWAQWFCFDRFFFCLSIFFFFYYYYFNQYKGYECKAEGNYASEYKLFYPMERRIRSEKHAQCTYYTHIPIDEPNNVNAAAIADMTLLCLLHCIVEGGMSRQSKKTENRLSHLTQEYNMWQWLET